MIRGLSLLLLTGCMANDGAGTLSMAQENVWNLARIEIGMTETDVLKIMHCPHKKQTIEKGGQAYYVWFYVTKPTALAQERLVRQNVTPLTFKKGVLQGWGFDYYDHIAAGPQKGIRKASPPHIHEDKPLQKEIEGIEEPIKKKPKPSFILTQNSESEEPCTEDSEEDCHKKKRKVHSLGEEDEEMIRDADDQNFNFW